MLLRSIKAGNQPTPPHSFSALHHHASLSLRLNAAMASSLSPEPPLSTEQQAPTGPLIVIKVGTSTLMKVNAATGEQRVNLANFGALVDAVTTLHRSGKPIAMRRLKP